MNRTMASIVLGLGLHGGLACAADGDALVVGAERVNLREGAGTDRAVVRQLDAGMALVEVGRDGEWVNVRLAGEAGVTGWVHATLVAPKDAGATTPAAEPEPDRFATFVLAVDQMNAAARGQGYEFFSVARDLGGGIVEVVATDRWLALPVGFQQSNFTALENLWREGSADFVVARLRIVDANGNVVIETPTVATQAEN